MNSASNLPSRRTKMNALISVLQPSPAARETHRRLGHVLECQRHELLNARAEVWEPGEVPEPRPVSAPKPPPIRRPSGAASHDKLLPLIGAVPITIRDLRAATGLGQNATYNGLHHLLDAGRIRNLSKLGHVGRYVLTGVVPVKPPKVVKPRKVRANPNAKHDTNRAQLLLALTTTPQDYRQLARATGLPVHTVKNCLSNLVDKGLAKNHARSGQRGSYTLPKFAVPTDAKGWCDV